MRKIVFTLLALLISFAAQAQNLYGDMEVWRSYKIGSDTVWNPQHWFSYDSLTLKVGPGLYPGSTFVRQTFQTTDAHSGTYAVKLITRSQSSIGIAPGVLVNAYPQVNLAAFNPSDPYACISYAGGTGLSKRVATVYAWIKYAPVGSDNGEIVAEAHATVSGKDSIIGRGDISVSATSNYTLYNIDVSYTSSTLIPQNLIISFYSSAAGGAATADSSTMYIDDVTMTMVDVPALASEKDIVSFYPNPSKGVINIQGPAGKQLHWQLYDLDGQFVFSHTIIAHTSLDLSYLLTGLYFYNVTDENSAIVQRGKLSIMK